jgi:hypothetical protein
VTAGNVAAAGLPETYADLATHIVEPSPREVCLTNHVHHQGAMSPAEATMKAARKQRGGTITAAVVGAVATVAVAFITTHVPSGPTVPGNSAPGLIDKILVEIAPAPQRDSPARAGQPEPTPGSTSEAAREPDVTPSASSSPSAEPAAGVEEPEPVQTTPRDVCADGVVAGDPVCVTPPAQGETPQDSEQEPAGVDPQVSAGPEAG